MTDRLVRFPGSSWQEIEALTHAVNLERVARATARGVRARVKRKASRQRVRAVIILRGFVDDDSRIVRIFAMRALADLADTTSRCAAGYGRCWRSCPALAHPRCAAAAASSSPAWSSPVSVGDRRAE